MPRFRTGTDDFKELRDDGGYFVDKSPFVRDVIEGNKVTLLPRPRRFGKTLNMTMLRYFFEKVDADHSGLFDGLEITRDAKTMAHQGKYPVIYMSLKDVKGENWVDAKSKFIDKIADMVLQADVDISALSEKDQVDIRALTVRKGDATQVQSSLSKLISILYRERGRPVIVLIDEYDSPVIEAWNNGYYDEMIQFMRSWLGGGLKHENGLALYRAVVTGILRVAKESVFSGLNNLDVANMLKSGPFADKFGFTQAEVNQILTDFNLPDLAGPIREWYNGYDFGGHTIYNPWSVIKCVSEWPNPIGPQWLNTASNTLIHHELERGGLLLKRDLEKLLTGEELRYPVQDSTTFFELGKNTETIWSFLFFSGYLKASDPARDVRGRLTYKLAIPNREVVEIFETFVENGFAEAGVGIQPFLECFLEESKLNQLELLLSDLVRDLISHHDVARYPEAAYHAFVLGLLANLRLVYEIRSNPESGYGRADIIMRPKTTDYPLGFVIEFKSIPADGDLEKAAMAALAQIEAKAYATQLTEAGIKPEMIRKLAIVVSGKRVKVLPAGCKSQNADNRT